MPSEGPKPPLDAPSGKSARRSLLSKTMRIATKAWVAPVSRTSPPVVTPAPTVTPSPTRPDAQFDDSDHERMTHIVLEGFKPESGDFVKAGTNVVEGMVNGVPVRALCGKTWVPGRDPQRYPLCPTCREIAKGMGWRVPG
jgi:hypothetical protein